MSFFKALKNFNKKNILDYPLLKVVEVKPDDYIHHETKDRDDCLFLYYLPNSMYEIVLYKSINSKTAFR